MSSIPRATWSDYHDAVDRLVVAIDGVIERGRARERQYEGFLQRTGKTNGSSAERLKHAAMSPAHRHVLQRLLDLTAEAHASLGGARRSRSTTTPQPAAVRFLASRSRI